LEQVSDIIGIRNFTDVNVIQEEIQQCRPIAGMGDKLKIVPLDDSFPRYLLANREKFSSWIKEQ